MTVTLLLVVIRERVVEGSGDFNIFLKDNLSKAFSSLEIRTIASFN